LFGSYLALEPNREPAFEQLPRADPPGLGGRRRARRVGDECERVVRVERTLKISTKSHLAEALLESEDSESLITSFCGANEPDASSVLGVSAAAVTGTCPV